MIVPDLPGFGRTTAPKELEAYSYKAVIDDLVALVKHVQGEEHAGEKIVLGGHDWGGLIAWYVVFAPFLAVVSGGAGNLFAPEARKTVLH